MIEPLGDQDHGFVAFVWSLGYAIQDLREKPDGLDPSAFFLTRLRLGSGRCSCNGCRQ